MTSSEIYYNKILKITEDYLGPAADRFLNRQINTHLQKSPNEITKSDVHMVAVLIRSRLVVLTHNQRTVDEAFKRLKSLELNGIVN